jgi:Flp pilus assembly protein TadD
MKRLAAFVIFATALLLTSEPVAAGDCEQADLLVKRAVQSKSNAEELLHKAVQLCPKNVAALNNLAVNLENLGRLDEAEQIYRRAISADASAPAPHAGLGDVLAARGDNEGAAEAYRAFLARLAQMRRAGVRSPLVAHEAIYQRRLAGLSGDVVPAEIITRSLTRAPVFRTRGLGVSKRILDWYR